MSDGFESLLSNLGDDIEALLSNAGDWRDQQQSEKGEQDDTITYPAAQVREPYHSTEAHRGLPLGPQFARIFACAGCDAPLGGCICDDRGTPRQVMLVNYYGLSGGFRWVPIGRPRYPRIKQVAIFRRNGSLLVACGQCGQWNRLVPSVRQPV